MSKITVDLRVTSRCNMKCDFCHGAPKGLPDPSFEQLCDAIRKVHVSGASRLVISGGEPLVRCDIVDIVCFADQLGLEVYLSTNGLTLLPIYDSISPHLSWIGLPLDGSTPGMNVKMSRSGDVYRSTFEILKFFFRRPPKHRVKVGTVVSMINYADIMAIGSSLFCTSELYQPSVWRLYDFAPRGEGFKSQLKHRLSPSEFESISCEARQRFGSSRVVPLSNSDHDNSYFFINPDLSIVTAEGDSFPYLGNIGMMDARDFALLLDRYTSVATKSERNREWIT